MPRFTWTSVRRWATLVALLSVTLVGSGCAGLDLNNTDHSTGSPPEFALYISGTQHTDWSQDTEQNDNGCIAYAHGKASQTVNFALANPVRVRAVQHNGHIQFRTIELDRPLEEMAITGAFDRTSTFHAGVEGTGCGAGQGNGSSSGSQSDCGHRLLHSSVRLLAGGDKMQVVSYFSSDSPTWRPDPGYDKCYMGAGDELVGSDKADSASGSLPGPITATVDVGHLLDSHNLHLVAKAHGAAQPKQPAGSQATVTLDWTATFCRLNSDLSFDEALQQAHDLLAKSPKFTSEIAPLQSAGRITFQDTTPPHMARVARRPAVKTAPGREYMGSRSRGIT